MIQINVQKIKELWNDPARRKELFLGGAIVLGVVYFSMAIIPQFAYLAALSGQLRELDKKVKLTEGKIDSIDEMKVKVANMKEELGKHEKQLPAEKEVPALLEGLASIAQESGVKITGITPYELREIDGAGTEGKYYRGMPVRITAKSGYHQLGHFVTSIENEKRIIIIDDLQIRYDKNNPRMHDVVMMVKTYVSIENKK